MYQPEPGTPSWPERDVAAVIASVWTPRCGRRRRPWALQSVVVQLRFICGGDCGWRPVVPPPVPPTSVQRRLRPGNVVSRLAVVPDSAGAVSLPPGNASRSVGETEPALLCRKFPGSCFLSHTSRGDVITSVLGVPSPTCVT